MDGLLHVLIGVGHALKLSDGRGWVRHFHGPHEGLARKRPWVLLWGSTHGRAGTAEEALLRDARIGALVLRPILAPWALGRSVLLPRCAWHHFTFSQERGSRGSPPR